MKMLAVIACIGTALAATSADAFFYKDHSAAFDACQSKETADTIDAALLNSGWRPAPRPLPDSTIEQLIWPQMMAYLSSDTGGESMASLAALQRKTVTGFGRKKDIPTSKTRIYRNFDAGIEETLLMLWQIPRPGIVKVICRFSLRTSPPENPQTARIERFALDESTPRKRVLLTRLNTELLSQDLEQPVTVGGVLETSHLFEMDVSQ